MELQEGKDKGLGDDEAIKLQEKAPSDKEEEEEDNKGADDADEKIEKWWQDI